MASEGMRESKPKGRPPTKLKPLREEGGPTAKRRCVSTACIACRKRKSKCDGNTPSCAACSSVYHTPCVYDPNSDHRRKGVYKKDIDKLKNRNTTLQTLVEAILKYDEEDVWDLVRQMRSSDDLEAVAESIIKRQDEQEISETQISREDDEIAMSGLPHFESELAGKFSELKLDGIVKYVGGTSNLIFLPAGIDYGDSDSSISSSKNTEEVGDATLSWTTVTKSEELVRHLLTMYFTWHYPYFTTLSRKLFYRDFIRGRPSKHCSALLVNAMLALGCHFSSWPAAREDPENSATAGDHFFREAKRLILENDEYEKAKLCTVQAFALMSVREAGCGREGRGWVYSGMSFRMACDLGLNVDVTGTGANRLSDEDIDARRITFWGCFLFDKCWSNYLGRQPQLSGAQMSVPKPEIFPDEDSEMWAPYTDMGVSQEHAQPARTRAVALQIANLCEISSDLMTSFYNPVPVTKNVGKQEELRRLSQLHTRLEAWRKNLPKEMEPKDGQLPHVLLMHMFFQLLFIHLYRPFLKYTKATSPLPSHVSPRKLCTQSAAAISKLLRIYKRAYDLRQICNVAVYIVHSACTIHLLNLPDKGAKRDIIYGLKNLEEMAEFWLCARRTLRILDLSAQKWHVSLPPEATAIIERAHAKFGSWASWDQTTSPSNSDESTKITGHGALSIPSTRDSSPDDTPKVARGNFQLSDKSNTVTSTAQPVPSSIIPISTQPPVPGPVPYGGIPLQQTVSDPPQYNVKLETESPTSPSVTAAVDKTIPSLNQPQIPAFPSFDDLVEESRDWWFKDQQALALGLDNWDWSSPDRTYGEMELDQALPLTDTPTPPFTEGNCPQPGGIMDPNIGMQMPPNAPGYYIPVSPTGNIPGNQSYTGPSAGNGSRGANTMFY